MRYEAYVLIAVCTLASLLAGCAGNSPALLEMALSEAGGNAPEIESVLSHYDGERAEIAEALICSMPGRYSSVGAGMDSIENLYRRLPHGDSWYLNEEETKRGKTFASMPVKKIYDLPTVKAQFLICNIDDAYSQWKSRKWNKKLSIEQFCELILPYRIGDERLSEWRIPFRKTLSALEDTLSRLTNSVEAARVVSDYMGCANYNDQLETPSRAATDLLELPLGYCREDCARTLYEMRAVGIPVAVDMMLVSPDNGTSHQWNVVYDTDDGIYRMFGNDNYFPTRDSIHYDKRRKGKVYRQTFGIQTNRLRKYIDAKDAPLQLLAPLLKDVTAEYFGKNHAVVPIAANGGDVYLALFTPSGFHPIDIAEVHEGNAVFSDIEPEVIFFPVSKTGRGFRQCGYPFMLTAAGETHLFIPDSSAFETVTLTRKMPVRFILHDRVMSIDGTRIETARTKDGPWRLLHTVIDPKVEYQYTIPLRSSLEDKFIRLVASENADVYVSEIIAAAEPSDTLGIHRVPLSALNSANDSVIADGDILTWKILPKGSTAILKVGATYNIAHLFLSSYNDDNYVVPGEEYELLYFTDGEAVSLGEKVAEKFEVEFYAPENAVLWLRNLTKGTEEQVFIYSGGRQLYNIDLRGATSESGSIINNEVAE